MYIKLLGADASSKNLGQIVVDSLDETTAEIMKNWTRFSFYSQEAYHLNKLITTLKENSLWSKVYLLWLPWMANDVDELLYNPQGVQLSYFDIENGSLYAEDGIIKFIGSTGGVNKICECGSVRMPDYDLAGKFVSVGSNDVKYTAAVMATAGNPASKAIFCMTSNQFIVSPSFNWNFGYGVSRPDVGNKENFAGTMVFNSSFSAITAENLSNFKLTSYTGSLVNPATRGTVGTGNTSKVFRQLLIGKYFNPNLTITTAQEITGKYIASYLLGNTTLTDEEAVIVNNAMANFAFAIKELHPFAS